MNHVLIHLGSEDMLAAPHYFKELRLFFFFFLVGSELSLVRGQGQGQGLLGMLRVGVRGK